MSYVLYKMTVQAILLFVSETWNLVLLTLKCTEGFHLRAVWHMKGKFEVGGLEEVRLFVIAHYMGVGKHTITNSIVN